jgi:hypothetical protein
MADKVIVQTREELKKQIEKYLDGVATKKEKQRVLLAGARVLRNYVRDWKVPRSSKPHTYYGKSGKITIEPGNLAQSIYTFREKTGNVSVGPRVLRKIDGVLSTLGKTPKTSSGYYAAALYGSADSFRRRVTEASLNLNLTKINKAMQRAYDAVHRRYARKAGII